jgi:hypothetical protein
METSNIYCIKCKEKTDNVDTSNDSVTDKNGKAYSVIKAICATCGCRKNKFAKLKTVNDR